MKRASHINSSPLLYKRASLGLGTLVYWVSPLMVMMMMICYSTFVILSSFNFWSIALLRARAALSSPLNVQPILAEGLVF